MFIKNFLEKKMVVVGVLGSLFVLLGIFIALNSFVEASADTINTGHWRTVTAHEINHDSSACSISQTTALNQSALRDGRFTPRALCTASGSCAGDMQMSFHVGEKSHVEEMTMRLSLMFTSDNEDPDRFEVSCVAKDTGDTIAVMVDQTFFTTQTERTFEVPNSCINEASNDVILNFSGYEPDMCMRIDFVGINVRSQYEKIPATKIQSPNRTCTQGECLTDIQKDDGIFADGSFSCNISGDNYSKHTEITFPLQDSTIVTDAEFVYDVTTSGSNAQGVIQCKDQSDNWLDLDTKTFSREDNDSLSVPQTCRSSGEVTMRIKRTGSNCIKVDHMSLLAKSPTRSYSLLNILNESKVGSCFADKKQCLIDLNSEDNYYSKYLTCGLGESSVADTKNTLSFTVPEYETITSLDLQMSTYVPGPNGNFNLRCLDGNGGNTVHELGTYSFDYKRDSLRIPLDQSCYTSATVYVEVERVAGSNCLAVDKVELVGVSDRSDNLVTNNAKVLAYIDEMSVLPGGTLPLYIHTDIPTTASITVTNHGLRGQGTTTSEIVLSDIVVPTDSQNFSIDAYKNGYDWDPSYILEVPSDWESGIYSFTINARGKNTSVVFNVLEDDIYAKEISDVPVGFVLMDLTWSGYNAPPHDAKGFYKYSPADGSGRRSTTIVSTERPDTRQILGSITTASPEVALFTTNWLSQQGYEYATLTELDVHKNPSLLNKYQVIITGAHPEYWSIEMMEGMQDFLDAGGSLLYLSGNGLYWKVSIDENNRMEVQKQRGIQRFDESGGGLWREEAIPEATITGVAYTRAGFCTSAGYEVFEPSHPVFANTGVATSTVFGADVGTQAGKCGIGMSGAETDKMNELTPTGAILLAKGTNPDQGGGELVIYDHPGGGTVFSAGSIDFTRGLGVDVVADQLMRNILDTIID